MYIVYRKPITEVFAAASQAETPEQRAAILKQHDCEAVRTVLKDALDPKIKFGIAKIPSYKLSQMPEGHHPANLWNEARRLYIFLQTSTVPMKRQLAILTQILETMDPKEAQVYEDVLTDNFSARYPALTAEVVNAAFPGLIV